MAPLLQNYRLHSARDAQIISARANYREVGLLLFLYYILSLHDGRIVS